ncbi:MAG: hypothetical protein ICV52_03515 [Microcoleus sp. C1-bin4]|nr:hypothetical protein [Microcoleus sp. C1-bin4]
MPVSSQQKSKLKPDPTEVWERIKESLQLETAPEIARKLGLTKQSVYEWQKKLPGLDNLITIAEGTTQHSFQGMQWKLGYIVAQEEIRCLKSESFPQLYW